MASRVVGSLRSPLRAVPIATVVGVSPLLVSSVEATGSPELFAFAFAFSTFVRAGLSTLFLGRGLCQDVGELYCVLDHILACLFEGNSSSHLHCDLPGECVPGCLDLLEAIIVSPGQGLKALDVVVDVDLFSQVNECPGPFDGLKAI